MLLKDATFVVQQKSGALILKYSILEYDNISSYIKGSCAMLSFSIKH